MAEGSALTFEDAPADLPLDRSRRVVWELVAAYGLILVTIWTPLPWQRVLSLISVALVLGTTYISFEGWQRMGFRMGALWRSLWVVAIALGLALLGVFLASRLHTLHSPETVSMFVRRYCTYAIWAFFQQFLMLDYFLLRLLRLLSSRITAVLTTAALFAVAHLPNPILTPMTMLWGLAACLLFLRYRNLYTLGLTHAILGISIAITIPGPVDHNMRVGLGYYNYKPHGRFARSSSQPDRPQRIDRSMSDRRSANSAFSTPGPPVEDSSQRGQ
jgi:membrane protease YdiL (CAAX protease family)